VGASTGDVGKARPLKPDPHQLGQDRHQRAPVEGIRQPRPRYNDPPTVLGALPNRAYLAAVAADLYIELVHSAVPRPQGRGKIERFFGTLTTELPPQPPGQLVRGRPVSAARPGCPTRTPPSAGESAWEET